LSLVERFGRHDAVVLSADRSSVLVDDELALPRVWTNGAHPADVSVLVSGLRAQLGQPVTVLRCLCSEPQPDGDTVHRCWQAELHNPQAPLPLGFRWIPSEAFEISARLLAERSDGAITDGREWERPGWAAAAHEWIKSKMPTVEAIEQIRCWEFSYVARVSSASGTHYFKALPTSYGHEPPLTQLLAERHSTLLPRVIAVDTQRRWMLTRAAKGVSLERRITLEPWLRTVRDYAELQRTWASRMAELRAVGCRDTNLPLHEFAWVEEAQRRLDHYELPRTIDHGDFWPSNVFVTRARGKIIDWTDAGIGHPFFSLVPMRLAYGFDRRRSNVQRLREAYLEPWGGARKLAAAFDLAQPLGALYYAAKIEALQAHNQWWLPRFVPWLEEIANREAASLVW